MTTLRISPPRWMISCRRRRLADAMTKPRSSRERYRRFLEDYRSGRLDEATDAAEGLKSVAETGTEAEPKAGGRGMLRGKRREYLRDYFRWLRPHRFRIAVVFAFALVS